MDRIRCFQLRRHRAQGCCAFEYCNGDRDKTKIGGGKHTSKSSDECGILGTQWFNKHFQQGKFAGSNSDVMLINRLPHWIK